MWSNWINTYQKWQFQTCHSTNINLLEWELGYAIDYNGIFRAIIWRKGFRCLKELLFVVVVVFFSNGTKLRTIILFLQFCSIYCRKILFKLFNIFTKTANLNCKYFWVTKYFSSYFMITYVLKKYWFRWFHRKK